MSTLLFDITNVLMLSMLLVDENMISNFEDAVSPSEKFVTGTTSVSGF